MKFKSFSNECRKPELFIVLILFSLVTFIIFYSSKNGVFHNELNEFEKKLFSLNLTESRKEELADEENGEIILEKEGEMKPPIRGVIIF